jgi:hypothetical protein
MQGTDHNKIIGIIHIAYGAFSLVVMIIMVIFMVGVFGVLAADQADARPLGIIGVVMVIALLINVVFTAPSFIAGYAMLKRKTWARGAALVAAILDALNVPFGTALCVYTVGFMLSNEGKALYDSHSRLLPPPPPDLGMRKSARQFEYVPPIVPPDWR